MRARETIARALIKYNQVIDQLVPATDWPDGLWGLAAEVDAILAALSAADLIIVPKVATEGMIEAGAKKYDPLAFVPATAPGPRGFEGTPLEELERMNRARRLSATKRVAKYWSAMLAAAQQEGET